MVYVSNHWCMTTGAWCLALILCVRLHLNSLVTTHPWHSLLISVTGILLLMIFIFVSHWLVVWTGGVYGPMRVTCHHLENFLNRWVTTWEIKNPLFWLLIMSASSAGIEQFRFICLIYFGGEFFFRKLILWKKGSDCHLKHLVEALLILLTLHLWFVRWTPFLSTRTL